MKCMSSFLAHEGRLSDPQRALIVEESGTSTVGAEARSDSDDGIPIRWIRVPRGYRLPQKSWCFHGRSGSHAPRIQRRGHSDPVGPCPTRVPGRIYTNQECPSLGAFDFSVPVTSEDEGPTPLPILHIIVEESGSTTGVEPESDGEDTLIRWVHVPRGYRLPAKPKKANILAEVVGAFGAANS